MRSGYFIRCYYNVFFTSNFPFVPTSHYGDNGKLPITGVSSWMWPRPRARIVKVVLPTRR